METVLLHFGTGAEPRQTVEVEARQTEAPRNPYATGYGARIPSRWQVKWAGRWRRVYVACFSNSGTAYIGKPGAWLATVSN